MFVKWLFSVLWGYFVFCGGAAASGELGLASTTWHEGASVPLESVFDGSGCNGANLSPQLAWSGAPSNTKSFAITILDLDAPKPGGWWHWIIFNIPGNVSELGKGAGTEGSKLVPAGASQCLNDYGTRGYGGPCPPPGAPHRYLTSLYALKVDRLPSSLEASPAKAVKQIEANSIGAARMTVKYQR
jgi:Raf kinase inhibitor-like YbhB/YbcL family protein